jgi:tetratricopeptide (TPR) repeat protein
VGTQKDQERAIALIQQALNHQMAGDLAESIRLYKESIGLHPTVEARTHLAMALVQQAMNHQMAEEFDEAIRLYKESIALCPTADAHTYLGWAYSFQGRIDEAIAQCEIAIKLDPEFGNPYNDIGVYLMQQQNLDEAIPWLEKAKQSKRYEPRHFPYINLGRVYLAKGMIQKALEEFRGALQLNPDDAGLAQTIEELETKLQ